MRRYLLGTARVASLWPCCHEAFQQHLRASGVAASGDWDFSGGNWAPTKEGET